MLEFVLIDGNADWLSFLAVVALLRFTPPRICSKKALRESGTELLEFDECGGALVWFPLLDSSENLKIFCGFSCCVDTKVEGGGGGGGGGGLTWESAGVAVVMIIFGDLLDSDLLLTFSSFDFIC